MFGSQDFTRQVVRFTQSFQNGLAKDQTRLYQQLRESQNRRKRVLEQGILSLAQEELKRIKRQERVYIPVSFQSLLHPNQPVETWYVSSHLLATYEEYKELFACHTCTPKLGRASSSSSSSYTESEQSGISSSSSSSSWDTSASSSFTSREESSSVRKPYQSFFRQEFKKAFQVTHFAKGPLGSGERVAPFPINWQRNEWWKHEWGNEMCVSEIPNPSRMVEEDDSFEWRAIRRGVCPLTPPLCGKHTPVFFFVVETGHGKVIPWLDAHTPLRIGFFSSDVYPNAERKIPCVYSLAHATTFGKVSLSPMVVEDLMRDQEMCAVMYSSYVDFVTGVGPVLETDRYHKNCKALDGKEYDDSEFDF